MNADSANPSVSETRSAFSEQEKIEMRRKAKWDRFKLKFPLHLMMLPAVIILAIYEYYPMVGLSMAFQHFIPTKGFFGSEWVGLQHFEYLFSLNRFKEIVFNTLFISSGKIIAKMVFPIMLALLLNEIGKSWFKRSIQTITYLPFFLSWVVVGGMLLDFMNPHSGALNEVVKFMGLDPIYFWGNSTLFPWLIIISDLWKDIGFSTIIFLAALTSADPSLYEAAIVDGANRWKQTLHVSMPAMMGIIFLSGILSLGEILRAGFGQIFMLYSELVYSTGDVLDTFIYRIGLEQMNYSIGAAVGLFQSAISFVLIVISYYLANKYSNYRIF